MQSPDVNMLVSAFRQDTAHHDRCRAWLGDVLVRPGSVLDLSEPVLSGI